MSNIKRNLMVMTILTTSILANVSFASDVYIDQAGSTTTVDITQSGSGNRIGSSGTPTTLYGDTKISTLLKLVTQTPQTLKRLLALIAPQSTIEQLVIQTC